MPLRAKLRHSLLAIMVALPGGGLSGAQEKGALERAPAPRFVPVPGQSGNVGLFVGVNEFPDDPSLAPLKFAVNDAIALAHFFVVELRLIDPQRAFVALSGEASGEDAIRQLGELRNAGVLIEQARKVDILKLAKRAVDLTTHPAEMLIVSLSSHGFEQDGVIYVMPRDGLSTNLREMSINLTGLTEQLASAKPEKNLLLIDACREKLGAKGSATMTPEFAEALAQSSGRVMLTACSPGQISWEYPDGNLGAFTFFVLEALRGNAQPDTQGLIRIRDLLSYVNKHLKAWSSQTKGKPQEVSFVGPEAAREIPLAIDPRIDETISRRVARLREMFNNGTLTADEQSEGERLLRRTPRNDAEAKRRGVFEELADGRSTPEVAKASLAALPSGDPDAESRRLAAIAHNDMLVRLRGEYSEMAAPQWWIGKARGLARAMPAGWDAARELITIAQAQLRAGDRPGAMRTLDDAFTTATSGGPWGVDPRCEIARLLVELGNSAGAVRALDAAEREALAAFQDAAGKRADASQLQTIALLRAEFGDEEAARKAVRLIPTVPERVGALLALANQLSGRDDVESAALLADAEAQARATADALAQCAALTQIAAHYAAREDAVRAVEHLRLAEPLIEQLSAGADRDARLSAIASIHEKLGDTAAAQAARAKIADQWGRYALDQAAKRNDRPLWSNSGSIEIAIPELPTFRSKFRIQEDYLLRIREDPFSWLRNPFAPTPADEAIAQARNGDLDAARRTAEALADPGWYAYALLSLAEISADQGNATLATELLDRVIAFVDQQRDLVFNDPSIFFNVTGALSRAATVAAQYGDFATARRIAARPELAGNQGSITREIAVAQAKHGDLRAASDSIATLPTEQARDAIAACIDVADFLAPRVVPNP